MILAVNTFSVPLYTFSKTIGILAPFWEELVKSLQEQTVSYSINIRLLEEINKNTLNSLDGLITLNVSPAITELVDDFNQNHSHHVHLYAFEMEPPHIDIYPYDPFYYEKHTRLFVLDDSLPCYNDKFVKVNYPYVAEHRQNPLHLVKPFKTKKLAVLINSYKKMPSNSLIKENDLYHKRIEVIEYFKNFSEDFDFYGYWWENSDFYNHLSYKGSIEDKVNALSNYKFAFCFENCFGVKGYITEKILDAFFALTVPIYWGAPDITSYIPSDCFIDMRNFNTFEELHAFLIKINEETYETYLKNIQLFLKSPLFEIFYPKNIAQVIANHIITDLQEPTIS